MTYHVFATDTKYYATEGETKELVRSTSSKDLALQEAAQIRNANPFGTAWVEDKFGNKVEEYHVDGNRMCSSIIEAFMQMSIEEYCGI